MTCQANDSLIERFENLSIDPGQFAHRDHVETAFAMLRQYPYLDATQRYANTIRQMASNAGAAEKFHVTITLAFIGLIAERMSMYRDEDFGAFIARNPDLLEKKVLERWYSPARLGSDLARTQFLLPDRLLAS